MGIEIPGYGITAMEACRIEGGFIVPGWDCATERDRSPGFERTPYELNLGWLVELNQVDFVGRDALRENKNSGQRFALRGLVIESRTQPDEKATIQATIDGEILEIGTMPCISYSWGMERMIGNGSIQLPYADLKGRMDDHRWRAGGSCVESRTADQPSTPYPVARAPSREPRNVVEVSVGTLEDRFQLTPDRAGKTCRTRRCERTRRWHLFRPGEYARADR